MTDLITAYSRDLPMSAAAWIHVVLAARTGALAETLRTGLLICRGLQEAEGGAA